MTSDADEFGEAIREAREYRGWSQEFLAARVGTTQSTIDRIETGITRRSRVLPEIAAALDLQLPGIQKLPTQSNALPNFVRVTCVLPRELMDRVNSYKNDIGIPSDDEALRRLIDDSLKHRDTYRTITDRLITKLNVLKSLREAAGYVLANHPLVKIITFEGEKLKFVLETGYTVEVFPKGVASITDDEGEFIQFRKGDVPHWAHPFNVRDPMDRVPPPQAG